LATYTPSGKATSSSRQRLYRDWRKCNNPAIECFISNSTSINLDLGLDRTLGLNGSPILDHVKTFKVTGLNPKNSGSFQNQFQTLQVEIEVVSPNPIEGTTKTVSKKFTFFARAKNVSLVP
jgi:hypothetical protein